MKTLNSTSASLVETPKKGIGLKTGLVLMVAVIVLVAAAYFGFTAVSANSTNPKAVPINGYFLDVNGDGKIDYVVSSEVIINDGTINLTPSP